MIATVQPVTGSASSVATTLRTQTALGRRLDVLDPAVVRRTAAQFAAELFFAPLLAEVRKFPFGQEFATGGQTEAIFGEQLDQRVADAVAQANPALINGIVRRFQQRSGQPAAGADRTVWPTQQQVSEDQRS